MSQDKINEHLKHKKPVQVIAMIDFNGYVVPYRLRTEDGNILHIQQCKERQHCAALKAGGVGWRYTVDIGGQPYYLFYDDEGTFFLEV